MSAKIDVHPIEEQMFISRYMRTYGLESEFFERIIGAIFRDKYAGLVPGSPSGGADQGIDIMHITIGGNTTVWCITTEKEPNVGPKLRRDAIKVMNDFESWHLNKLETIYLCTCRKLTNKWWKETRADVFKTKEDLVNKGVKGVSDCEVIKYDCDCIAGELSSRDSLDELKKEILRHAGRGLSASLSFLSKLGPDVPGEDEIADDLSEVMEEIEPSDENWSSLYRNVIEKYKTIERSTNEGHILSGVEDIGRLVASIKIMGHDQRAKQIPPLLNKLNKQLWPNLSVSWPQSNSLAGYDVRIAASFVYTSLALQTRMGNALSSDVDYAHHFVMNNAREGRLSHHKISYKLIGLLAWQLHRNRRYNEVSQLLDVSDGYIFTGGGRGLSQEAYVLSLVLGMLYLQALRHREGGVEYLDKFAIFFHRVVEALDQGYWRQVFCLLELCQDNRTSMRWAETREQFIRGFNNINKNEVSTHQRTMVFMRLLGIFHELSGKPDKEACEEKMYLLTEFNKRMKEHPKLMVQQLLLELRWASLIPYNQLPEHVLKIEALMKRMSGILSDVRWLPIKLRFLRLFLLRVFDPRVLNYDWFVQRSSVLTTLLSGRSTISIPYFGIEDMSLPSDTQHETDAYSRLKPIIRPLIFRGLSIYANKILPNMNLLPGNRVGAALDYLNLLSQAEARYSEIRLSVVLHDTIQFFEKEAHGAPLFHYYLSRIYYRHSIRDITRALWHLDIYWNEAGDLDKSRIAGAFARVLYENIIYSDEEIVKKDNLNKLLKICAEFFGAGKREYFISCYYGIALSLHDPNSEDAKREDKFLAELKVKLCEFGDRVDPRDARYYDMLLGSTIYTNQFHEYLKSRESQSYIAASLLSSLDSPEIYNVIATHLISKAKYEMKSDDLLSIKILYDIAVGLARGEDYFMPKYQFNRVCCDIVEMQIAGAPKSDEEVHTLASAIGELHKLVYRFVWARRYIHNDLCDYLYNHRDDVFIGKLLSHPDFNRRWGTLRNAFDKKIRSL